MDDIKQDIDSILSIEPFFEVEPIFFEPFWILEARMASLQRFIELNQRSSKAYLKASKAHFDSLKLENGYEYVEDLHSWDSDFFFEYLFSGALSHGFSLLETLLDDVASDVAESLGKSIEDYDDKPMPYINRYIRFLEKGCGYKLGISKETWKRLDTIREVRNKYIHKLNRDLPKHIEDQIKSILNVTNDVKFEIDYHFTIEALKTICELAECVQREYWKNYKTNK